MDDLSKNPFDEFDNEQPDSAAAVLQPGPAPTLWESFKQNFAGTFGEFEKAPRQLADARVIRKVEQSTGVAQPGDSPLAGKPSQTEYDQARARLAEAKQAKEGYDAFESPTLAGKAMGLTGGLVGGVMSPSNLIGAGGVVARGGMHVLGRFGIGGTAAKVAGAGIEAGAINAALDLPTQAMQIGAGLEEHYDPMRTAMAFGFGQVAGSGMAGVAHLVNARRVQSATEAQRVDDYLRTRNAEMAGGTPDGRLTQEFTGDNLPPIGAKVNPETLARVTDAAKVSAPDEGGLVRLDITPQDRDALRTAGYPVSDDNKVPQSVVADLARTEATQAVEPTARGNEPTRTETPATARPNETQAPSDTIGTAAPRAGETPAASGQVRPAGDARQPGESQGAPVAGKSIQVDRRVAKEPSSDYPDEWFQDQSWKTATLSPLDEKAALYVNNPNVQASPNGRLVLVNPETGSRVKYTHSGHSGARADEGSVVGDAAPFKVLSVEDAHTAVDFVGSDNIRAARKNAAIGSKQNAGKVTQEVQPVQVDGRLGTTVPQGRLTDQPSIGSTKLSAPQAISLEPIRRDLGLDIPGTLIESPDSIKAFHGSPHDFEKFSLEHIGTGEGAQAYGHGLYFAESQKTAKYYHDVLNESRPGYGEEIFINGKPFDPNKPDHQAAAELLDHEGDREAAIKKFRERLAREDEGHHTSVYRAALALLERGDDLPRATFNQGSIYEVRIAAHPDKFLDWDKPLSEQRRVWDSLPHEIRNAIDDAMEARGLAGMSDALDTYTGRELYQALSHYDVHESLPAELPGSSWITGDTTEKVHTAKYLESLGIQGIRYLDGSSRKAGEGSRNFVVFDDNLIQIVSKNGVPLKKPIPIVDYLRGEATARFGEELKTAGVKPNEIPAYIMRQAEKYVKEGERDMGAAVERATIERKITDPATADIAKKVYGDEVQSGTARPDGSGIGETSQGGTGRQAEAGTGGTRQDIPGVGEGRGQPGEAGQLTPQALRPQAKLSGPPTNPNADARFPNRELLKGEGGARTLPANAKPEEIASFRITEQLREIATAMGSKLETDGRFTLKGGVLGEYDPKDGVIRIRFDGDTHVFNHELGHKIDQRLSNSDATKLEWKDTIRRNSGELRVLDANDPDPAKQTVSEGTAEFLRMYLDNPEFARRQAPNFADEFERIVLAKDPELKSIVERAYRVTQIDSGMKPVQRMTSMVAPAEEPTGWRKFNEERKKYGIPSTLALNFDRFYANVVGKDRYVDRMVRLLNDAHFEKTGQPLPRQFQEDPYKLFRMLPGAKQAAIDGIYFGVREYGKFLEGPKSASLRDGLSLAFHGEMSRMDNPDDPLAKAFSGYLIARRSRNLYDRWEAGDLRNPPVRASKNEVLQSIAEFERANPQFVEAADKVFSYANAMWKKKFEAGLVTKEIYDTVAAKGGEYVPFFRDMQDDVGNGPGGASGAGQQQSVVKSIKGSTRDILDPVRSLMYDAAQTERIIAINDTFKGIVKLAESGGEFSGRYVEKIPNSELKAVSIDLAEAMKAAAKQSGLDPASADGIIRSMESLVGDDLSATVFRSQEITPSGERIFFIWENGERAAYKVGNDPFSKNFFETISSMSNAERDIMLAMFGKTNAMFSQFITNAPQFAVKNLIMDNMSRIFIAKDTGIGGYVPGGSIAMGLYTQLFDREFAKSYAAIGGIRGGVASAASRDLANQQAGKVISSGPRTWAEFSAEAKALVTDPKRFAVEVAKSPLHAIELVVKAIESTETIGRLGQAKLVQSHLKKNGVSDADAMFGAVFEARDILDYDRRGFATVGATRFLPFLNVGIQGISHANEVLVGNAFRAALQAYQRGGLKNLDGNQKAAMQDAVKAWGMIAAGATMSYSYAMYMSDDPVYQAQSDYMRRKYWIFPAGQDESGRNKIVTWPKPFDNPGAVLSAVEGAAYSQRRADGKTWERVSKAMEDAIIPRQFSSVQDFLSSQPILKTGFETVTGIKVGFDGGANFPIVPDRLKSLPPDQQFTSTSSWFAKKLGDTFGVSPMVADHVMNGLGGTSIRDANYGLTAAFGDNPNITAKDAMNRTFFGALYRDAPGGGQFRSDLMQLMSRDNGKYSVAAAGYKNAKEIGDPEEADRIYSNSNETGKTLMTMRAGDKFKPAERQLHPLERTYSIGTIIGKVATDLSNQELEILNGARRKTKKGEERNIIEIDPTASRAISNTLQSLMAEETRNGLVVAGEPGYQNYDLIDTKLRYEAIRKLSPEVADELAARMKAAHILPIETVKKSWPEVKRRLLQDKSAARITDLRRAQ